MPTTQDYITTFESRFGAFIPEGMYITNQEQKECPHEKHDDAGILIKLIAYLIDLGISAFIIPIFYNVYHYLKRWQTLGQKIVWIRVYRMDEVWVIASISQLLTRFIIKLLFLALWAVIWINIMSLILVSRSAWSAAIVTSLMMLIVVHLYAASMISDSHNRGLHDLWSNTIVAYDHGYSFRQFLLWAILCAVIYYIVLGTWPQLLSWIGNHTHWILEARYREAWVWIDQYIISGITTIGLQ